MDSDEPWLNPSPMSWVKCTDSALVSVKTACYDLHRSMPKENKTGLQSVTLLSNQAIGTDQQQTRKKKGLNLISTDPRQQS